MRQHKRKISQCVKTLIPAQVVDLGTSLVVVQEDGPTSGSFQNNIAMVFPEQCDTSPGVTPTELVKGIAESSTGRTHLIKISKPIIDVTKKYIVNALPPQFLGGRRTR